MTTRRGFIRVLPLGLTGAAALPFITACGDKAAPPAPPPAAMPAPAPAPMPMATPAPMPDASAPAMPDAASAPVSAPVSAPASAGSTALVSPQDPAAIALGYVAVASSVDAGKYTKYAAGQACNNCALYQGMAGAADGPCPLFGGRHVAATGWCSAYVKKG